MLAARFRAQLLTEAPASTVLEVVRRICAVQAQDERGFRLAVRARSAGLTAADVDRALTVDRSVVVTWFNRATLHLVAAEDYWWLHALTAPTQITMNARRLEQEGVAPADGEHAVEVIVGALAEVGPLDRHQLRARVAAAGIRTEGQALIHLLLRASLLGHVVRGPLVGGNHAYVLVRDWLGNGPSVDRDVALAELARRFLAGHGPATDRDLAKWSGLPLRDSRRGLAAIADETVELSGDLFALSSADAPTDPVPEPRLLGQFEPVLMGWTSRVPILGEQASTLVTSNGIFRPFALVHGRAVATWRLNKRAVELEPFGQLDPVVVEALRADGDAVVHFFDPLG